MKGKSCQNTVVSYCRRHLSERASNNSRKLQLEINGTVTSEALTLIYILTFSWTKIVFRKKSLKIPLSENTRRSPIVQNTSKYVFMYWFKFHYMLKKIGRQKIQKFSRKTKIADVAFSKNHFCTYLQKCVFSYRFIRDSDVSKLWQSNGKNLVMILQQFKFTQQLSRKKVETCLNFIQYLRNQF